MAVVRGYLRDPSLAFRAPIRVGRGALWEDDAAWVKTTTGTEGEVGRPAQAPANCRPVPEFVSKPIRYIEFFTTGGNHY